MPWKATCAMDERFMFVADYQRGELSVSELCRQYGVSRRTGYKWIGRYEAEGPPGLRDRSHAAHDCPHRLGSSVTEELLTLRIAHPTWGPRKIRAYLENRSPERPWPAPSTIGDLLSARGLTVARKKRRRVPASAPFGSCVAANDVWTVDFKGWFRTGDGSRCDPLTMSDAATRYFLRCQALAHTDLQRVWPVFDAAFR